MKVELGPGETGREGRPSVQTGAEDASYKPRTETSHTASEQANPAAS